MVVAGHWLPNKDNDGGIYIYSKHLQLLFHIVLFANLMHSWMSWNPIALCVLAWSLLSPLLRRPSIKCWCYRLCNSEQLCVVLLLGQFQCAQCQMTKHHQARSSYPYSKIYLRKEKTWYPLELHMSALILSSLYYVKKAHHRRAFRHIIDAITHL